MVENFIFDVDGTLWDSSETVMRAWNSVFEKRGLEKRLSLSEVRSFMGATLEEIGELFFPEAEEPERKEILSDCVETQEILLRSASGRLYPNVRETLSALSSRYGVYIVSNCVCGYIEALLSTGELTEFVDGFLCAGMTGKDKGENISLLIEARGLKNCVYVGDTRIDELACEKAGVPFIHAAYGFGKPLASVASVGDISELLDLAERL